MHNRIVRITTFLTRYFLLLVRVFRLISKTLIIIAQRNIVLTLGFLYAFTRFSNTRLVNFLFSNR